MSAFALRLRTWLGYHLARAPEPLVRRITARSPIAVDGQRLEARTQHALALMANAGRQPLHELPVDQARVEYQQFPLIFEDPPLELPRVEDRRIPGPAGDLSIRIYASSPGARAQPALLFFHGGGGVIGSIDTHDGLCRLLTGESSCVVVSAEYRLGPEHPFPAAPEDAHAAFEWVVAHADELGLDPERIAVGGDSHGGCLAAVVCQLARDAGRDRPRAQLLIYPSTDRVNPRASRQSFGEGFLLDDVLIEWFTRQYLGDADRRDPRASPLLHPDLSGLPPAVLMTAGFDPLRDEGQAYAEALQAAGGTVTYRCADGLVHGFAQMTGAVPAARRAIEQAASDLRALLRRP